MAQTVTPYTLKSGGHIFSDFGAEIGYDINIKELRVQLYGWTSQLLVHDCPSDKIGDFKPSHLISYAKDKGVNPKVPIVTSVATAISRSVPLRAEYGFRSKAWFYNLGKGVRKETFKPLAMADYLDQWMDSDPLMMSLVKTGGTSSSLSTNYMFARAPVPNWREPFTHAWWDQVKSASVPVLSRGDMSDFKQRCLNPQAWFEDILVKHGLPVSEYEFFISRPRHGNSYDDNMTKDARSDCTTIIGPVDHLGYAGMWRGPKIDDHIVIRFFPGPLKENAGGAHTFDEKALYVKPRSQGNYKTSMGEDHKLVLPEDYSTLNHLWEYTDQYGHRLSVPRWSECRGVKFLSPTTNSKAVTPCDLPFMEDAVVVNDPEAGDINHLVDSPRWKLSWLNGLEQFTLASASAHVVNADANYPVDKIIVTPQRAGAKIAMLALREFMQFRLTDPTLTDKERAGFTKALEQTKEYADALLYLTVMGRDMSYPTIDQIRNLRVVRDAKKADLDLMNEDFSGQSFLKAGKWFENQIAKGKRGTSTVSRMIDEQADIGSLLSPRVARNLHRITEWTLKAEKDPIDDSIWILEGTIDSITEPLSRFDFIALVTHGANTSGVISDEELDKFFGVNDETREDLLSITQDSSVFTGGRLYHGTVAPRYALQPGELSDTDGYPILSFADTDSAIRAMLIHKGMAADEPSGLLCAMIFANQLDVRAKAK